MGIFIICVYSCAKKDVPDLTLLLSQFPSTENIQYTVTTTWQQLFDSTEFTDSFGKIECYGKISSDSNDLYRFKIDYSSANKHGDTLIHTTLLYDGKNYLRLHHDRQSYVLGGPKHSNVQSWWGNIYALKVFLSFLQLHDSIEYTIKEEKVTRNIILETIVNGYILLSVPIQYVKYENDNDKDNIKETYIKIVLKKDTYFPLDCFEEMTYADGRKRTFQYAFGLPGNIPPATLSVLDSIPSGYMPVDIPQNVKNADSNPFYFPAYRLQSLTGAVITNENLSGKIVLYDFFSLYCGPCRMATDDLVTLRKGLSDPNFEIICVDILKTPLLNELQQYMKTKAVNYTVLLQGNQLQDDLNITSIPTFILVDGNNRILQKETGYAPAVINSLKTKAESELLKLSN
jgi:thiol-disulfide isomerase/thioredoxin